MSHLSPSAIFSPSVARQQQLALKDWNYIDAWLTTKLGKTAPPFERNVETLKALLALASLNEQADEDRDLLSRVEAKGLDELQAREAADSHAKILSDLEENLSKEGNGSLQALAEASVQLNVPYADLEMLARKLLDVQVETFDLEQASGRVDILHRHLEKELQNITNLITELRSDAYQPPPELARQTLDQQRKIKLLVTKLPELRDRVAALNTAVGNPKPTIQDMQVEEEKYKEVMATARELEAQVKNYHGLPHDVDLARLELETLRVELMNLSRQRDATFEGLVERETPRKPRPGR
jgi:HAUS augmin-like complex subunit 1